MTNIGSEIYQFISELFPICRSITGNGSRKTLQKIQKKIPIKINEIPTGTSVFDWTIPKEWNIKDAYIKDSSGKRIVDFKKSNLHVVNYSIPINKKMNFEELKNHLYSKPEYPDIIPYRTTYYEDDWGFCLSHNDLLMLKNEEYDVCIDSDLSIGSLSYGELYLEGELEDEVLISTHICHPSMCNDNLSGIAESVFLANYLAGQDRKYSYRFIFIPATIGAIAWLSLNEKKPQQNKIWIGISFTR